MLNNKKEVHIRHSDYTLDFGAGINNDGSVHFTDHTREHERDIGIFLDNQVFNYRVKQEFPSTVADMIDLAIAIHISDRLAFQNLRQEQRGIRIVLPVRHPELLNAELLQAKLKDLLEWATGTRWIFDFQKRCAIERTQPSLSIAPTDSEVALWSGGLDALAGLYERLQTQTECSFVLFGTGSNVNVHSLQEAVAQKIQSDFPNRSHLYRFFIRISDSGTHQKNTITRARGVVFAMLGAACASLMGRQELCFYENGTGAINLPYSTSAIGLDHTRSVHPLTLLKVSEIVSDLLGETFRVWNPFLFSTKAQMCKKLYKDGRYDLPPLTKSCDSPHRKTIDQCGYCSSCLLRRQALAASKLEDTTRYLILHGNYKPAGDPSISLKHMLAQVDTLRGLLNPLNQPEIQWKNLACKFPVLDDIVDNCSIVEKLTTSDMKNKLIRLYQNYVTEWDEVRAQLSVGLINSNDNEPSNKYCLVA
jgi:7-cyano-7-deazaguanine synthase in queuosine biosynthesis